MPVRANVSAAPERCSVVKSATTKLILAALSPQFSSPVRSDRSSVFVLVVGSKLYYSNRKSVENQFCGKECSALKTSKRICVFSEHGENCSSSITYSVKVRCNIQLCFLLLLSRHFRQVPKFSTF